MKAKIFDGLKGFNIPVNWDSDFGWDVDGKQLESYEFYSTVAAVYRAMNLNAGAVAEMPFALVRENGEDFDTSADWQNKGNIFGESPGNLFGLWRKSLGFTNAAYGMVEKKAPMRYIVPATIKPITIPAEGLVGFKRKVGNIETTYPLDGPLIHIYDLDWDVEAIPSDNTEYKAVCAAAGIAYYSDHYVGEFFQRGAIKPHLLQVKGMPNPEDRQRIESWWDRLMRGVRGGSKVVNADTMEAKPIGSGVDDFKDNSFYKDALSNIAMATGIPLSLLLANSANLATAKQEYKSWYDNEVITSCGVISRGLNQSSFMRSLGLRLEFRTLETDPDQEEEQKKSYSFVNYASVFVNNRHPKALSLAAQLVGLDMPQGWDFDDLDEQKEEEPQQEAQPSTDNQPPEIKPANDPEAQAARDEPKSFIPTPEQDKELETWKRIAKHNVEKGKGYKVWEPKDLPADVANKINTRLSTAETVEEVVKAFVLGDVVQTESDADIKALVEALNHFAGMETKSPAFHMGDITVNVPERSVTVTPEFKTDAPIVNVTVPEQAAPIVNVTNEVNPTPVTVKNDVTVQPATVAVKAPKKAKVKRDRNGNIESIEAQ